MQAVEAGKSVHNEKPLVLTREEGKQLLAAAEAKGVRVGGAPDTFMGGGIQTCRKLIDDGWIGEPIGAQAFMLCHGHESWHPDPEFYYKVGGGPMFDMGPYYLTALVSLLGPVKRVTGSARITFPERTITSEKKHGTGDRGRGADARGGRAWISQAAPIGTIITSFDVWARGRAAHRDLRDRGHAAACRTRTASAACRRSSAWGPTEWSEVPLTHGYAENSRGIGLADMAAAHCRPDVRTAPAASWPTTCWTSCTPSTTRPNRAGTSSWKARANAPPRCRPVC